MIILASDHAGFELKNILVKHLKEQGHDVVDMGANKYNKADDYPDVIYPAAEQVALKPGAFGIILGGSGQGEAMTANKVKGIRATVYYGGPTEILILSKEHNNANILSLGARFLSEEEAKTAVDTWLDTKFTEEERHTRRVIKLNSY